MGADLKERVCRDFHALHDFLQKEEAAMLHQLRRDQTELEHSLEHQLDALHTAVRELEQTMSLLQTATGTIGNMPLVEVKVSCLLLILV